MGWLKRRAVPGAAESDIRAELAFHIERTADDLEQTGMSREHALAEAQRRFGPIDAYEQRCWNEAPEAQMTRVMTYGMGGAIAVLVAAVVGLVLTVFEQRRALHTLSDPVADPHAVAMVHASLTGTPPVATIGGRVQYGGEHMLPEPQGMSARKFVHDAATSAGFLPGRDFTIRVVPKYGAADRTLAWQRSGLPVRFETDGAASVLLRPDRTGGEADDVQIAPGDTVFVEQSHGDTERVVTIEGELERAGIYALPQFGELTAQRLVTAAGVTRVRTVQVNILLGERADERLRAWVDAGGVLGKQGGQPCVALTIVPGTEDPGLDFVMANGDRAVVAVEPAK